MLLGVCIDSSHSLIKQIDAPPNDGNANTKHCLAGYTLINFKTQAILLYCLIFVCKLKLLCCCGLERYHISKIMTNELLRWTIWVYFTTQKERRMDKYFPIPNMGF